MVDIVCLNLVVKNIKLSLMQNSISLSSKSVTEAVSEVTSILLQHPLSYGQGMETAADEAAYLVSFVVGLPPDFTAKQAQVELDKSMLVQIQSHLEKRVFSHIPLAYLLGETWQAGYKFYVNEHVLIPRSPIAHMIAEEFFPWLSGDQPMRRILDVCTGSGCLGILAAMQFPQALVDISDIDQQALNVAQRNIRRHSLDNRINAVISDVYEQLPSHQYDIITANPPYVPQSEQTDLPREYTHEPEHALFADQDGLEIAKRIIFGASKFLTANGLLILEVGQSADTLQAHFPEHHFLWHELEFGGEGVCVLSREECKLLAGLK